MDAVTWLLYEERRYWRRFRRDSRWAARHIRRMRKKWNPLFRF